MSQLTSCSPHRTIRGPLRTGRKDEAVAVFQAERARLLRRAQRITGDFATAEDVVQEVWIRWQRADRRAIRNPAGFLTTATTHLAITAIQTSCRRREIPSNLAWVPSERTGDPTERLELAAAVDRVISDMSRRLSPAQLAAILLREGFEFSYEEIAQVLDTTASNARQLVRRGHLAAECPPTRSTVTTPCRHLVTAFRFASETGDLSVLIADLLAARTRACAPRDSAAP